VEHTIVLPEPFATKAYLARIFKIIFPQNEIISPAYPIWVMRGFFDI